MKIPQPTATYINENSCIEDIIAIAKKIKRRIQPATARNSRKNSASPQRANKQTGIH
jgi:hypothetical protein